MKKIFAFSIAILINMVSKAQDTVAHSFWEDPINDPMMPLYAVSAMLLVSIILVIVVVFYMLRIINLLVAQAEKERAIKDGKAYTPKPSAWSKLVQKLNASVPVEQEQDIDMGHSFDGIRELDNHLPPWWTWLFIITIVWAVVYMVVFHVTSSMPLSIEEYTIELSVAQEQADKLRALQPAAIIDENTLEYTADPELIAKGKSVFASTCVACHRNDGGGSTIGPNLTDEYWIHGGSIKSIYLTIKNGKADKGMPEWGKSMSAQDVRNVAFYVMSLQGTKPAEAKAPQGELYIPDENVVVSDSLPRAAL